MTVVEGGPPRDRTQRGAALVSAARHVLVVTGAGVSVASGLPTYRLGGGASWDDRRLEQLAHASRYGNHLPELWKHWRTLRERVLAAPINPAHQALATWQQRLEQSGGTLTLVTQNVDGLHTRAGARDVLEVHGSIVRTRCMRRGCGKSWDGADDDPGRDGVPRCPSCNKRARPDVVLFGERLAADLLRRAEQAARAADLVLYAGTSGHVAPVCDLGEMARPGTPRLLLDLRPWAHRPDAFDHLALGPVERTLPALVGAAA